MKLRQRLANGTFGRLAEVNVGERPPTKDEVIAQLEADNLNLMLALTDVYEQLLAIQTGGTA